MKTLLRAAKEAKAIGMNKVKASDLSRWPVAEAYSLSANHPFDGWLFSLSFYIYDFSLRY